jgi:hypothetical protein
MKPAPPSRQHHDSYRNYQHQDSEISGLLGECGLRALIAKIDVHRLPPATIATIATFDFVKIKRFYCPGLENSMKKIISIFIVLMVAGCDGSPESKAKLRALGKASCAMSMHCDPSQYDATGNGWSPSGGLSNHISRPKSGSTGGAITISAASLCPLHSSYGFFDREVKSGMNKICFYK